ncbi:uncharacterized protein LOC124662029 [Lolium rigidum]|uniref:uncharacterized protein LOC124662029 n=1 Tax=Lolium rigidum TaxID=89674 RepID=UPI001F5C8A52|nr:uncharacterized protein LOC124662029 [Lolium rigidum]
MALRSPSSTRRQDEPLRDSPPADSPPPTSQPMSLVHNDNKQDQKEDNLMIMSSIKNVEEEAAKTRQEAVQLKKRLAELELAMVNLKRVDIPINGGSSHGAKADAARKTKEEVDQLLVKLEMEGLEIDGKVASIIDDGIWRIKAEAVREPKGRNVMESLLILAAYVVGFVIGVELQENKFREEYAKMKRS